MREKAWMLMLLAFAQPTWSHEAKIVDASARGTMDALTFSVTLEHAETGWDDYADGWRVELEDGTVLGTRVLYHPHVEEQPFTRSLSGVSVPEGTKKVFVRSRTLADGWGESLFELDLRKDR